MRFISAAVMLAAFALASPATAAAACCEQHQQKGCCTHHHAAAPDTIAFEWENDPQLAPAPPARQLAEVWFHQPVLVGKAILQGRYVIEHDNERMARGEPCTHIYAFNDRTKPVAAFACTHLERDRADQNIVMLVMASDGRMHRLTEFQFAGETSAHGYPTVR